MTLNSKSTHKQDEQQLIVDWSNNHISYKVVAMYCSKELNLYFIALI
jgi:hypothetical protein